MACFPLSSDPTVACAGRRTLRWLGLMLMIVGLSACAGGMGAGRGSGQKETAAPARSETAKPAPTAAGNRIKVALLAPLSGDNAALGAALLNAAQVALFDHADERLALLPRDTQGTAAGAAVALRTAMADGAQMAIGPLFAAEVAAIRGEAQAGGLPLLAFTNDQTQAGGSAYLLGFLPGDQVVRVLGFASSRGVKRVASLAPRGAYGDVVAKALHQQAERLGLTVVWEERYDPAADLSLAVANVAAHKEFDALLVAEGGERLKTLAPLLAAQGLDARSVRLLGTGLWDDPALGQEMALVGGWFAAPTAAARADFEARYKELYKEQPPRLASLAYDAMALAAVLARTSPGTPFASAALTNPSGFSGIDGLFRLTPAGVAERSLAVLEVAPGRARVADPAPTSFPPLTH